MYPSKGWQREIQIKSEDQLSEFVHSLGWELDKPDNDYGEDYWVRIFSSGNPTGDAFFIQLKGTATIGEYRLKQSSDFSYPISKTKLSQWHRTIVPVIVILWDVQTRLGYWVNAQEYVSTMLKTEPKFLSGKGKRQIHILEEQQISIQNEGEQFRDYLIGLCNELRDVNYFKIWALQFKEDFPLAADAVKAIVKSGALSALPDRVNEHQGLAAYEAALSINPLDADAWTGRAEIFYQWGDMEKALEAINQAAKLAPSDANIACNRGSILAEYAIAHGGKPKRFLHEAIQLFQSNPGSSPATQHYNIGNSLAALGKFPAAIEHYDKALVDQPSTFLAAEIWKNRGTAFFNLGDYQEEIRCYQQAIELEPQLWQAYSSWAATEYRREQFGNAQSLFLKAIQANPKLSTDYSHLYYVAYSAWHVDRHEEAYHYVNQALNLRPEDDDAMLLKAFILASLWRTNRSFVQEAHTFLETLLLDDPANVFAKSELHLLYKELGNREQARRMIEDAVTHPNIPPSVLVDYARLLEEDGEYDKAIEQLERAFKQSQEHHIVHTLAHLKKKVKHYQEAVHFYTLAIKDCSDPFGIMKDIADCHYLSRQYKDCVRIVLNLILHEPSNTTWWNNLSVALEKLKRSDLIYEFSEVSDQHSAIVSAQKILASIGYQVQSSAPEAPFFV